MGISNEPTAASLPEPYGPEVLCANWNPVAASMGKSIREVCPEWLDGTDVETFLLQVYRSQRI
jgi:hypothetical protein